jgi:hypothetical protein
MTDAGVCPFCQAALPATFCATSPPPGAPGRMSRAARLLAGATLVGVSACSSTTNSVVAPPYGTPPHVDASRADQEGSGGAGGSAGSDAGAGGAPANDAAEDRSAVALYGGPFPTDGSASG